MIYQLPELKNFEKDIGGQNTHLIALRNRRGMQVAFTDYGARIVSVLVPDKSGNLIDVALGFNSIQEYIHAQEQYHGATIGRYANRIAQGKFSLDGNPYTLAQNNGINNLHGGPTGFHTRVWDRQVSFKKKIDFNYVSVHGEEGFPGTLKVNVSYELTEENEIIIKYIAETDQKTVVNLTNHAYFNLNGEGNGDILNHIIHIPSEKYIPIDENQIPLGEEIAVHQTPFDFTSPKKVAQDIGADHPQIKNANGYDHSFVNTQPDSIPAASAYSEESGIQLKIYTSSPGLHLYTGNFLADDLGKSGHKYLRYGGFCFEAQHYPDSPNQPQFPKVELLPEEVYEAYIIYKFNILKAL